VFRCDDGVKSVRVEDADFHVGHFNAADAALWDDKAAFNISGAVYCHEAQCEAPARFTGSFCVRGACGVR